LALSNIVAPKLARRPTGSTEDTKDEPYAWETREFLRKKLVGRSVHFIVDVKVPSGREYGAIYLVEGILTRRLLFLMP
jgi:staphylococcal nuclease domain-containing protein 1